MFKTLYRESYEHDSCGIGAIVDIKGKKSHSIISDSLVLLRNLDHRGARGADSETGDGAGILLQLPYSFFLNLLDFELPKEGSYAVGMLFMSHYPKEQEVQFEIISRHIKQNGFVMLGKRRVPTNPNCLGEGSFKSAPAVFQIFVKKDPDTKEGIEFERKLYIIRKLCENEFAAHQQKEIRNIYFCSFSSRTIVYKGMLTPGQLDIFYPELNDMNMVSAIALTHSRFSTNTFPSWQRAHPARMLVHNGEINTIKGNVKWIESRQKNMASPYIPGDILKRVLPVITPGGSDSAMFDNTLEFLYLNGYELAHALMMMIPEPWENNPGMDPDKRAFYEYHSFLMEPWDGPAAMAFSDGLCVAATLDRNGLRPARYIITKDDRLILASEAGALTVKEEDIAKKGRLHPGKLLIADTLKQKVFEDDHIKNEIISKKPYRSWIAENTKELDEVKTTEKVNNDTYRISRRMWRLFGYTYEDQNKVLKPMAEQGAEGIGAMGIDGPLAVLSEKPQLLFNYFKQLFAQVTNPPIDAIREEIVTGSETSLGSEGNLLEPGSEAAVRIRIHNPILTNEELDRIIKVDDKRFKAAMIRMTYLVNDKGRGIDRALDEMFLQADKAVALGFNLLILTDKGTCKDTAPIPSLLAVSALNQHLVRNGNRTKVNILIESGETRETHHFALLIGYGASAVNPYMAFEVIKDMCDQGFIDTDYKSAVKNYVKASLKGIVKIMSKMGISTIKSYRGAQIFECIGINDEIVSRHFTGTDSRISCIGMEQIAEDISKRHNEAYFMPEDAPLDSGGDYQYRDGEEYHMYNPKSIYLLQKAGRENDVNAYDEFKKMIHEKPESKTTLRSLLEFDFNQNPIPIDEVEPVENIFKRFKTGAMSYGSISMEAHKCLAAAMNRLGGKSNTGEGGEDPSRYVTTRGEDPSCSAIKQIASGRFGVDIEYLNNAKEIQIKMAQGAKPGEGGQLPGIKVYPWIAKARNSIPGVGLISPPPHHDIYSIEDLGQLIYDLKCANPEARISVKLVSVAGVGTVAAGVAKAKADLILISGYDGGTGAAPRTSLRHAGMPWELGLAETHQTLVMNNLRDRVRLETDGKLMTGKDVVMAALFGADEYGFATAPLVVAGCVMMRFCNQDTCPVGVATQNPELRKCFSGKPEHIENYFRFVAREMRWYMSRLGFRTVEDMIGRVDRLKVREDVRSHDKYKQIDLSELLARPCVMTDHISNGKMPQKFDKWSNIDHKAILSMSKAAIEDGIKVKARIGIKNTDRCAGTITSGVIAKKYGLSGLLQDTIDFEFSGSAGQSFGAFAIKGMKLTLSGETNDYVGKGLSGGKLIIKRPLEFTGEAVENIITGNVALYGAISGEAYFEGVAGERFCVRNSGAVTVVEGVGAHACEYMTGGCVAVIGHTGNNFAAGMSGGKAFVYDEDNHTAEKINKEMVKIEKIEDEEDKKLLRTMLEDHLRYTGSKRARQILDDFEACLDKFLLIIPGDYKRMTNAIKEAVKKGYPVEEARMIAFEENKNQMSRVYGN